MSSLLSAAAVSTLQTFSEDPENVARRELSGHSKLFRVNRLGNRDLLSAAMTVEPQGIEIASGHLLCLHKFTRWYFLQDIHALTMLGRGKDLVDIKHGHRVGVHFGRDVNERQGELIGARLGRIVSKMNWDMTAVAVMATKKWKTALAQLPTHVTPMDMDRHQQPILMTRSLFTAGDAVLNELIADVAAVDFRGLYSAFRHGRRYLAALEGVVTFVPADGYTIIEVNPTEPLGTQARYHVFDDICDIKVKDGDVVAAGDELFTLFPVDTANGRDRYKHGAEAQRKQLVEAFGEEMLLAINQLYFANDIFVCSAAGHAAVPLLSAMQLSDETLAKYGVKRPELLADLAYDLSPVADCLDDEDHAVRLVPFRSASNTGRRYLSSLALDVTVSQ